MKDKLASINWGAVIIEDGELSMGRVMCWIIFGAHLWFWFNTKTVPATMFDILLVLFAYNFGKKLTGPVAEIMRSRMGGAEAGRATQPTVAAFAPIASTPAGALPEPAPAKEDLGSKLRAKLEATKPPTTSVIDDPFAED